MREQPQAKSTTRTRNDARLKWLFSYCLPSTPSKAGAARRTRSTWGKMWLPQPPSNPHWLHNRQMDTGDTCQSHCGRFKEERADVPSRLGTASRKCCWICLTSFPADSPTGSRRKVEAPRVWLSPGSTGPSEKSECWHSLCSAVHSPASTLW